MALSQVNKVLRMPDGAHAEPIHIRGDNFLRPADRHSHEVSRNLRIQVQGSSVCAQYPIDNRRAHHRLEQFGDKARAEPADFCHKHWRLREWQSAYLTCSQIADSSALIPTVWF